MPDLQYYGKKGNNMANWAKEIMILANDFCLNIERAREIVKDTDTITIPQGKNEDEYKYNRAYAQIRQMIMTA